MQQPSPAIDRLRRISAALELTSAHVVALLVVATLGCVGLLTLWWIARPVPVPPVAMRSTAPPSIAASSGPVPPGIVVVHVSGAVASEGVHELIAGSRVVDAIEAAGGVRRRARTDQLNLARLVHDGEQIHVPTAAAPGRSGGADRRAAAGPLPGTDSGGTAAVSLNTADAAQLETLPGVGPVLAERIISHRESSGGFATEDELLQIDGIGEKTFAQLRDLVTR